MPRATVGKVPPLFTTYRVWATLGRDSVPHSEEGSIFGLSVQRNHRSRGGAFRKSKQHKIIEDRKRTEGNTSLGGVVRND